ncbi:MAG: ATP-binding protein [Myxococcota bacterium]|nr:HAMP domain-containing sensor histidine kinase [Myxococcota bacterium]
MRLFTHLSISHVVPVIVVTLALGFTLAALVRISVVLTTLNDTDIATLRSVGALHGQAWALDVAMRHGVGLCRDGDGARATALIAPEVKALEPLVASAADGPIRAMAQGYLGVASEILAGDVCANLAGSSTQARRAQLDEQMTNIWVDRLDELHASVSEKDEHARRIAVNTLSVGIPVAVVSFLLAVLVARRMARVVNKPLETIGHIAQRVGRGDFSATVQVQGPVEILALAQEVERMREQLQQLDALKHGFLASVSHELRTPLSKIREALALLQDGAAGAFDPRQLRVINIARAACEQEIRLVTTLLDLSRMRAGSPLRLHDGGSIDSVLQSAVDAERDEANARGVELQLVMHGEGGVSRHDPVLLERAVANLIRNAVSVSKRGQRVAVRRTQVTDATGDARCLIAVCDDGPGVPAEIREQIFEPFVSRAVAGSSRTLGTGLGLALAREVARAHGGDVTLLQQEGAGATFHLWIPLTGSASPSERRAPPVRRVMSVPA